MAEVREYTKSEQIWLNILGWAFIGFCLFKLYGCYTAPPKDTSALDMATKKAVWVERGMDAVKQRLKDPASAQFRNAHFSYGPNNTPMSCGEVNSRNSFGGYSGFQRYVSAGHPELTFLEKEVKDFSNLWAQTCNN